MGNWLYELKQSKDGAKLVEAYKEVDEILQNSLGTADNETDFIIYLEDNYSISFGSILLVKMSQTMVDYALDNPKKDLLNFWSRKIVEEQYQLKNYAFRASANDLHNAFLTELNINGKRQSGALGKNAAEDVTNLFQGFSDGFRSLKFTREEYDPTLKSDKYLLKNYNKVFNLFDKGLDFAISSLQVFKERLVSAKIFVRTSEYFDGRFFDLMLKFVEAHIIFFLRLKKFLQTIQKISTVGFAFLCGVINGLIEFLAGIIDIVFLIIEGIVYGVFESNDEIKLDYLSLREALENFAEKLIKEPDFLVKAIEKAVSNYVDTRYKDEELTDYEIAQNAGVDLTFVVDAIISIVTVVKAAPKLLGKLPKFRKWIDDNTFTHNRQKATDWYDELTANGKKSIIDGLGLSSKTVYMIRKLKLKIKVNDKTIDLIDEKGDVFFRLEPFEYRGKDGKLELNPANPKKPPIIKVNTINNLFDFLAEPKYIRQRKIREATRKILNDNSPKYNPELTRNKGYDIALSENKLAPDFIKNKNLWYNDKAIVKIRLTGNRELDFQKAFAEMGITDRKQMDYIRFKLRFVWHHLDDLNENLESTLQLVKKDAHDVTISHSGSMNQLSKVLDIQSLIKKK
jgi:hypothetical protein